MGKVTVSVLFTEEEEARFSAYCSEKGFKKSTLIARLVRDHLDGEGYAAQPDTLNGDRSPGTQLASPKRKSHD